MTAIPTKFIKEAHEAIQQVCKLDSPLIWAPVESVAMGTSDARGITIYPKTIKKVAEDLDEEHLPTIAMEDKQKMLWFEVIAHEAAHQLITFKDAIKPEAVFNMHKALSLQDRKFFVQNSTVMNQYKAIDYLAGELEENANPFDIRSACNEFAAHMLSQRIMAAAGQQLKQSKTPATRRIGQCRHQVYSQLTKALKTRGLGGAICHGALLQPDISDKAQEIQAVA